MNENIKYVRLGDVCTIVTGSTPQTSNKLFWNGNFPWITPAELTEENREIFDTKKHLTKDGISSAGLKPIPKGSVLLSSRAPIGKVAITGCEMYCNQGFKNFICSPNIHNYYLYYFLKSHTDYLNSLGRGATFKEISKSIVEDIQIPLPPLAEQERIANVLDQITALKRNAEIRIQKLNTLVKARFTELFGDGDFSMACLGDLCEVGSGKRVYTEEFKETGIPFFRGTEISALAKKEFIKPLYYIAKEHYKILASHTGVPKIGDLLLPSICMDGFIWKVDINTPFYFKDGRVLWISVPNNIDSEFLRFALSTILRNNYYKIATGTTFAEMKIINLKKITIPLPPLPLQREFAAFVAEVDKLVAATQQCVARCNTLYRAKLQEFFGS